MIFLKHVSRACCLGAAGAALLCVLSGCGGTHLNNQPLAPSPYSDPTVQGLAPTAAAYIGRFQLFEETSGLGSPDGATGYITGAVDCDSIPIPTVALSPSPSNPQLMTEPLGFAPGGQYYSSTGSGPLGQAAHPGETVIFRASIAVGLDPGAGTAPPIVPSSVRMTSDDPEWQNIPGLKTDDPTLPHGYLPMGLNVLTSGALANGSYVTGTPDAQGYVDQAHILSFPQPFTTTGLHKVTVTVADSRNVVHHTDFRILVLAPGDSAIVAQVLDADGVPVGGATASLDSGQITPAGPATAQTVSDPLDGVVILFGSPGAHTLSVTGPGPNSTTLTGSGAVTLTANQAFVSADGATPYTLTVQ